jgi:hypothetical protein
VTTEQQLTLAAAILAFSASIVATAVALYNTRFRRFARERWWERQVEAYNAIIDALSALVYYYEEHYDAELEHRDRTETHRREIERHWRESYAKVKRATAVGAFLISTDAEAALKKMWKEKGRGVDANDWFGLIESDYVAARDCLQAIVDAARRDLRVMS